MTVIRSYIKCGLASTFFLSLIACSGAKFPASLGGASLAATTTPDVTTGSGTTLCGDGTAFKQCAAAPIEGATYNDTVPISVMASAPSGIVGWQAYVDNQLVTPTIQVAGTDGTPTGIWDAVIPGLTPGPHSIAINTWDGEAGPNNVLTYLANVNVVASPLPTPPTGAQVYSALQGATGSQGNWTICNADCSGSGGSGSSHIELAATNAPTMSGASLEETSTGALFNTLGYLKPPCPTAGCTSLTHFLDDVWFYIPDTTTALQALEFDPDVYDGNYEYFMSMQCDSDSGDWRFWSMNGSTKNGNKPEWTVNDVDENTIPVYPCTDVLTATNQWHHFQLYGTMNYSAHTYTYQTLVVDGKTIYANLGNTYDAKTYPAPSPAINVEQQIDNNSSATANSVYYDNYTLTAW